MEHTHMFVQPLGRIFPFSLHFSNKITTNSFGRQVPVCRGGAARWSWGGGRPLVAVAVTTADWTYTIVVTNQSINTVHARRAWHRYRVMTNT